MYIASENFGLAFEYWSLAVAIATFLLGTIVSVILYKFGRKLDFRSRMGRWDELRASTGSLLASIRAGETGNEIVLINARRYERDYDGGNNVNRYGDLQCRAEIYEMRHNGIKFFCGIEKSWFDQHGRRTLTETETRAPNVLMAGFVPFEYIEHINLSGDEFKGAPIFYTRFDGPGKSPYQLYAYHEVSSTPMGLSRRPFYPQVTELGEVRINRFKAWMRFWINRPKRYLLERRINRRARAPFDQL